MSILETLRNTAQNKYPCIVLPEATDARVVQAAIEIDQQRLARLVLLGEKQRIEKALAAHNTSAITVIDPNTAQTNTDYASALWQKRQHKGMTEQEAQQLIRNPIVFAMMMLDQGDADGVVAGAATSSAEVVRSALQIIGVQPGCTLVSSFFLMLFDQAHQQYGDALLFADCAMNIAPDSQALTQIAHSTIASAQHMLTAPPKVAFLSFSSNGSAKHALVNTVREAAEATQAQFPNLQIIGDIQLDAALDQHVLDIKFNQTTFNAPANVLIFPSLEAANIGYKLVQRFAKAQAIGPILQGLAKPVNDLSRGCTTEDIVHTVIVTASQV